MKRTMICVVLSLCLLFAPHWTEKAQAHCSGVSHGHVYGHAYGSGCYYDDDTSAAVIIVSLVAIVALVGGIVLIVHHQNKKQHDKLRGISEVKPAKLPEWLKIEPQLEDKGVKGSIDLIGLLRKK